MSTQLEVLWTRDRSVSPSSSICSSQDSEVRSDAGEMERRISTFESIITTYPPILESLLSQLPTRSIIDLYHTSGHLRSFLASYPLAWKTLSFRLPQPAVVIIGSPGNETPDARERLSKQYYMDAILAELIMPFGTRLKNLDLCNTAVTGVGLVSAVLQPRKGTLEHLSVRGCKNVSIKYHIVPFLEPYTQKNCPWARREELALKSLYTYRCRHHRRRPYLPSSLQRKDSDSEPTHQLISICHELGIWTDTAWCPTPGGRCLRRKDYHTGRAAPGTLEVWVPFDRLWRSGNRIGPPGDSAQYGHSDGRLWEGMESGCDGEALGPANGPFKGEGKDVPTHLRQSHRTFVENVKCDSCGDRIHERCENCSVRMHCMGCRRTLCGSCAFNRPLPRKKQKTRHASQLAFGLTSPFNAAGLPIPMTPSTSDQSRKAEAPKKDRFWWAPGAIRSPNLMSEMAPDDSSDSEDDLAILNPALHLPLKLTLTWCCLEPIFSGGGGIAFLGAGLGGRGADKIRAAPLPRVKDFEDPDFVSTPRSPDALRELKGVKSSHLYDYVLGEDIDVLPYLKQDSLDLQSSTCPRNLCQDCYRSFRWKVPCRACKKPLCKEHDFRALKVRKCGWRDLNVERDYIRSQPEPTELVIPAFKPRKPKTDDADSAGSSQGLAVPKASNDRIFSTSASFDINSGYPVISRPRALSVSEARPRSSHSSWQSPVRLPSHTRIPTPGHPRHPVQWEGCGAYFCLQNRPVGDCRTRCTANIKECVACGVYVCESCLRNNPSCSCSYCTTSYNCPHCAQKPEATSRCRREEEQRLRDAAELAERERKKKEEEFIKRADELAESVQEFFTNLFGEEVQVMEGAVEELLGTLPEGETQVVEDGLGGAEAPPATVPVDPAAPEPGPV